MIRVFEPLTNLTSANPTIYLSVERILLLEEFVSQWLIFDLQSLQIYSGNLFFVKVYQEFISSFYL